MSFSVENYYSKGTYFRKHIGSIKPKVEII